MNDEEEVDNMIKIANLDLTLEERQKLVDNIKKIRQRGTR